MCDPLPTYCWAGDDPLLYHQNIYYSNVNFCFFFFFFLYRYFPILPSYWFDWLPYYKQMGQLQVRVQTSDIQANDDDEGGTVNEGSRLFQNNQVWEIVMKTVAIGNRILIAS